MIIIKSIIFNTIFYLWSSALLITCSPFLFIFKRPFSLFILRIWGITTLFLLRWIIGLKLQTNNLNFPKKAIIACLHQSAWETIVIAYLFPQTFVVVKKELMSIPFYSLYVKYGESIIVDRHNIMSAARSLIKQSKNKYPLFIFPQGTRADYNAQIKCQEGVYILYKTSTLPVYPVILNSGKFWKRRSFVKYPGTITVKMLDPIYPGLNRSEFMKSLTDQLSKNI